MALPQAADTAIELHSLSKSHNMAGWRVGWVTGKAEFIQAVLKIKSNMDSGMFLPVQLAAAAALQADHTWYNQLNEVYHQRSAQVDVLLAKLGCTRPGSQSGLFVWARLPEGTVDTEFIDKALYGARVFITPGSVFGSNGRGYVRVSLCAGNEVITEALQRIEKWKSQVPVSV
jgi:aspartate/methionine/tyrosine aminotransferase